MSTTIKQVNAALRKASIDAELVRGDGYHYFVGPDVEYAFGTVVCTLYTSHLTVEQWLELATEFRDESHERAPLQTPTPITVH